MQFEMKVKFAGCLSNSAVVMNLVQHHGT